MSLEGIADTSVLGIVLIEKDTNGDTFITWNHPIIEKDWEKVIITRSLINSTRTETFSKYKDKWLYIVSSEGGVVPRVEFFSVCLLASEFNPEKFSMLCKLLVSIYKTTGNPSKMLRCFLDILTKNKFNGDKLGSFDSATFANKNHLLVSPLLDVIRKFEESSWILWSALIMKKRVVVFSEDIPKLLLFIRALPLFVLHRQDWSLLRPFVVLDSEVEMDELIKTGVYVAGFTSAQIKQRTEIYDVFVDLATLAIEISPHAQDDFIKTQYHQDFAAFMLKALETEGLTDQQVIKAVKTKTSELISKLEQLKTKDPNEPDSPGYISFAGLTSQSIPANMENFLYAVASAEGMTKISKS